VEGDDTPTVPNLRWDAGARDPGQVPTWPGTEAPAPPPAQAWARHSVGLGISLVANGVLLASLVLVLLFARAGAFSPSSASAQSTLAGAVPTATPTTPRSTPRTTSGSGWLQVTPSSVQLGCTGNQQTQFAVLLNTGPADVQWQVEPAGPPDQLGVDVGPRQGELPAGTSVAIQIHNTTQATGPHGVSGRQGVIRFEPLVPAAGPPPQLQYTTVGCQ
jgi:hypothetical protein